MKGIVLAGGSGTRLHPATTAISKQLLPVYDKPMVYYPLSVLLLAGIRDVLLISTPHDLPLFERLLGDGSAFGIGLSYAEQAEPRGLAEAFLIGRGFLSGDPACLVLGDNIFHGNQLSRILQDEVTALDPGSAAGHGCTLFGYTVADPQRYGVAEIDSHGQIISIEEKPMVPRSRLAITGVYMYDGTVCDRAASLRPSGRDELEITDLNLTYVSEARARLVGFGRGMAWLDTGTHDSLLDAATYVQVLEHRQDEQIACLEEIAYRQGWLSADELARLAAEMGPSRYGDHLRRLASAPPPVA
ncbi:MAG: Glucose-1-phosphate thymidylyltransferase [uncultured Acidimicrobiales bacterium]|uniref:Glucose-1-phosphate thymidylyltransferase n=1 Tax=uncultured Acidimicrobiales bacterium TaxID=310071 RepID=A0A6J4J976_9ACTN|nr:MAG: Glucose-1-phosphate thymidylyltransferase [uncultured Acidimicrobiales bacterium]